MRFQPLIRRISLAPALAAAVGLALAGCGSSGSSTPKSTSSSSSGGGSAAAAIKANWMTFFSGKTPVAKRVALLQNGQVFAKLIAEQATSPLASSASAKVLEVSNVTSSQATVTYDLLVSGSVGLPSEKGVAVFQGGIWKVGDKSFCGLLALEFGRNGIPPACKSAG